MESRRQQVQTRIAEAKLRIEEQRKHQAALKQKMADVSDSFNSKKKESFAET